MIKLKYCYHTHTFRCGHASGLDEDYVINALKIGIKRLGFSDHVMLPGINQSGVRGHFSMKEDYLSSIRKLQEKYKDQIDIKVGFEAEYAERFTDYYRDLLSSGKTDYLILGQHFDFDRSDNPHYIKQYADNIPELYAYADQVINGMRSGLFKHVAHPDLFVTMFKKWNQDCEKVTRMIVKEAVALDIPLEINMHARRFWRNKAGNLIYPYEKFWAIAGQYPVKVVVGYDAHHPSEFDNELHFVNKLIAKYKLNFLEDYAI
ncbi:MAG: histidinol-phosphatase [Erysipelotrichia bacterium]|nr:histidinol-phosphatase [Erysipelotrichia bacterium]